MERIHQPRPPIAGRLVRLAVALGALLVAVVVVGPAIAAEIESPEPRPGAITVLPAGSTSASDETPPPPTPTVQPREEGAGESGAASRWAEAEAQFREGSRQNVRVAADGSLQLAGDPSFHTPLYDPHPFFGLFDSKPRSSASAFNVVRGTLDAETPPGTAVRWQVRASWDGQQWTEWHDLLERGAVTFPSGGRMVQYRVTLLSDDPQRSPTVRQVRLALEAVGAVAPPAHLVGGRGGPTPLRTEGQPTALAARSTSSQAPTVRVWATREGLVGRRTANGHLIQERDRFVALPSVRVLSSLGGSEYMVRVHYPRTGRTAVAPVWDVGPWNIRDNYWDPHRDMFGDLPRWLPQSQAAYFGGYNSGLDQFGRFITIPTAIDLADGTFWDDLGMTFNDWVDVTFLWLEAPSPPPVEPVKITPKPLLEGFIETPRDGETVTAPLRLEGWLVDRVYDGEGTGIKGLRVYLDGPKGQGTYVGEVAYGLERPDVAAALDDERFTLSGYTQTFALHGVQPGSHTLYLYAVASEDGEWLAGTRSFVLAGAGPSLTALPEVVQAGAEVMVSWKNLPRPTSGDRVDVVPAASTSTSPSPVWHWTGGHAAGARTFVLVTPGKYRFRLFDENNTLVVSSNVIEVVATN